MSETKRKEQTKIPNNPRLFELDTEKQVPKKNKKRKKASKKENTNKKPHKQSSSSSDFCRMPMESKSITTAASSSSSSQLLPNPSPENLLEQREFLNNLNALLSIENVSAIEELCTTQPHLIDKYVYPSSRPMGVDYITKAIQGNYPTLAGMLLSKKLNIEPSAMFQRWVDKAKSKKEDFPELYQKLMEACLNFAINQKTTTPEELKKKLTNLSILEEYETIHRIGMEQVGLLVQILSKPIYGNNFGSNILSLLPKWGFSETEIEHIVAQKKVYKEPKTVAPRKKRKKTTASSSSILNPQQLKSLSDLLNPDKKIKTSIPEYEFLEIFKALIRNKDVRSIEELCRLRPHLINLYIDPNLKISKKTYIDKAIELNCPEFAGLVLNKKLNNDKTLHFDSWVKKVESVSHLPELHAKLMDVCRNFARTRPTTTPRALQKKLQYLTRLKDDDFIPEVRAQLITKIDNKTSLSTSSQQRPLELPPALQSHPLSSRNTATTYNPSFFHPSSTNFSSGIRDKKITPKQGLSDTEIEYMQQGRAYQNSQEAQEVAINKDDMEPFLPPNSLPPHLQFNPLPSRDTSTTNYEQTVPFPFSVKSQESFPLFESSSTPTGKASPGNLSFFSKSSRTSSTNLFRDIFFGDNLFNDESETSKNLNYGSGED